MIVLSWGFGISQRNYSWLFLDRFWHDYRLKPPVARIVLHMIQAFSLAVSYSSIIETETDVLLALISSYVSYLNIYSKPAWSYFPERTLLYVDVFFLFRLYSKGKLGGKGKRRLGKRAAAPSSSSSSVGSSSDSASSPEAKKKKRRKSSSTKGNRCIVFYYLSLTRTSRRRLAVSRLLCTWYECDVS